MVEIIKKSLKQDYVLNYIKKNPKVEQSKLVSHFKDKFGYGNLNSARAGISMLLKKLELQGYVKKESELNENDGSIPKNLWSAK